LKKKGNNYENDFIKKDTWKTAGVLFEEVMGRVK